MRHRSGGAGIMIDNDRTTAIQGWIDRLGAGDDSARGALLDCAGSRLARLTHKMLKGFTGVGRWEQTDDVLQNALLRLDRALTSVAPPTALDFFRLAAAQIRRELIDLARHYYGPQGLGANHASRGGSRDPLPAHPAPAEEPSALSAWCEFHEQVRHLPPDEREVVDLLFYQELTQAEAAELLQVTKRTVQRRWQSALLKLHAVLKDHWPGV